MITKLNYFALASLLALLSTLLGSAQEAAVKGEAPLDRPQALQFRTYDLGWIRFRNMDADGEPKLSAAESVVFPYQRYNNGKVVLGMSELEAPGAMAALIAAHEIAYDEAAVVGNCDPNKLAPGSSDVYCVPGTRDMENGQIFLALFDPDSHELAALTTTISNTGGVAVLFSSQPAPGESEDSNNCCYLGWQCSADWQWTNGWWAFQNNQCGAAEHATQHQMQQSYYQSSESRLFSQTGDSRQSSSGTETTGTSQCSCCNKICCWMQKFDGKWRWHCE